MGRLDLTPTTTLIPLLLVTRTLIPTMNPTPTPTVTYTLILTPTPILIPTPTPTLKLCRFLPAIE